MARSTLTSCEDPGHPLSAPPSDPVPSGRPGKPVADTGTMEGAPRALPPTVVRPRDPVTTPTIDTHEPPVRVMALHALAYCERLFYLEEVEETIAREGAEHPERLRMLLEDCLEA